MYEIYPLNTCFSLQSSVAVYRHTDIQQLSGTYLSWVTKHSWGGHWLWILFSHLVLLKCWWSLGACFNPPSLGCFLGALLVIMNHGQSRHYKWQSRHWVVRAAHLCSALLLVSAPRRHVLRMQGVMSLTELTWCCRGHFRSGKSSAVCCPWWSHGNGPPSHWQRTGQVSRWSPTWMGPSPESHQGIHCRPAGGHSTAAAGRCWPCSPTARR